MPNSRGIVEMDFERILSHLFLLASSLIILCCGTSSYSECELTTCGSCIWCPKHLFHSKPLLGWVIAWLQCSVWNIRSKGSHLSIANWVLYKRDLDGENYCFEFIVKFRKWKVYLFLLHFMQLFNADATM